MSGNITKKDFIAIWRVIGLKAAVHILFSSSPVALPILVSYINRQQTKRRWLREEKSNITSNPITQTKGGQLQ